MPFGLRILVVVLEEQVLVALGRIISERKPFDVWLLGCHTHACEKATFVVSLIVLLMQQSRICVQHLHT